jgi:glycerol-3-phosphate acyltransferase PlsY
MQLIPMASNVILVLLGHARNHYVGIALTAYLLGSVPFGYLLVRFFLKDDIRTKGSGNIGATNVIRSGAKKLGIATLLLDLSKGYVAVILAEHSAAHWGFNIEHAAVLAAVMATIGHVFPIWLGFRGGKGVATGLGVFLALAPVAAIGALCVFIIIFLLSRYVSLASIIAAALMPVFTLLLAPWLRDRWSITGIIFVPLLLIVKHEGNVRRLITGTENRFERRKCAEASEQ